MKDLRCMVGRHTGQADGGTMMYHCPRCGGDYWQPYDPRLDAATALGDRLIDAGLDEEALAQARATVREVHER